MLIDAHAHFDMYAADDLSIALVELERERVFTVAVTMDPASYARTKEIASTQSWLLPTFGIHPWRAADWADRLDELTDAIAASPMLGEIGLDFHWVEDAATYPRQRAVFEHFLQAARDQDKIVNLHTKGAEQEVLDLLRQYAIRRAIVHWYSGPMRVFEALVEFGAYFTVGVEVLQADARKIRKIARRIPADQLLTETDNPGGWEWFHSGEWGMPHLVQRVVDEIAVVRQITRDEVIALVHANFLRLLGDDERLAPVADFVREG